MAHTSTNLHIHTPLLHSAPLSVLASQCGRPVSVYLKMEALQPSGSFKIRGLGNTIAKAHASTDKPLHVITSSGGNAGLAAAYAARVLGLACTVFVPSTAEQAVRDLLQAEGARVVVVGTAWDDCDTAARQMVAGEKQAGREALYVHPFVGEDIVEGHSTMIDEIHDQLTAAGVHDGRPDAVSCSAGGAGLLQGVLRGLTRTYGETGKPEVVVTQCFGADSFGQSLLQARKEERRSDDPALTPVSLSAIRSKATSLGAKTCSIDALREALRYGDKVASLIVEDEMAQEAAWRFARDHRVLVELACSCVMVPVYLAKRILSHVVDNGRPDEKPFVLVLIVCGGSKIDAADLETWRLASKGGQGLASKKVTLDGHAI